MAMRDRIEAGNRCLVVVDRMAAGEWSSFANEAGELVVGSVDVSMHGKGTGKRGQFGEAEEEEGRVFYVSSMAVRREWQGRGLAQRLLDCVDGMVIEFEIGEVFLHVEWDDNLAAVHVYKKKGFEKVRKDGNPIVPKWLHQLAKKEHTLMRKPIDAC